MPTRVQRAGQVLQKYPPVYATATFLLQSQGRVRRRPQLRSYFASKRDFSGLQVGAGSHHLRGWLTTDLVPTDLQTVYMDAAKRFPFEDGQFDYVVAEHIIEHLPFDQAKDMLAECYRVLSPGGVLRISTPNILLLKSLMDGPLAPAQQRYVTWSNGNFDGSCDAGSVCHVVNRMHHEWGHQFLYDPDTLTSCLEQSGFTKIVRATPKESEHAALRDIDSHDSEIGAEFNQLESLIMEATKERPAWAFS